MTAIQDLNNPIIVMCEEDESPLQKLVQTSKTAVVRQVKNIKMDLVEVSSELVKVFRVLWNDPYRECPYRYVYVTKQGIPQFYDSIPKVELVSPSKNRRVALMFNSSFGTKTVEESSVLPWFSEEKPFFLGGHPFVAARFVFYSEEPISDLQVNLRITGDTFHSEITDSLRTTQNNVIHLATGEVFKY